MATLITPCGQEIAVSPQDLNAGFSKGELDHLIGGDCKAFRLQTGEVLLVDYLACAARTGERNDQATSLLRHAISDPGGEVRGYALLLGGEACDLLSQAEQAALFLDRIEAARRVLLLECNEEVRSVVALGLERDHFRVIHAYTATEAVEFCQSHALHLVVADVSSLRPQPLEALRSIQKVQPQAKVLLISGYEQATVASLYPDLLTGVEFLQKPFVLSSMAKVTDGMGGGNKSAWQQLEVMTRGQPDSKG